MPDRDSHADNGSSAKGARPPRGPGLIGGAPGTPPPSWGGPAALGHKPPPDASAASKIVAATPNEAYLVLFGIVGMIGYAVSKQNVQNGSIVAAIAGLALVVLVATQLGLFAGLLLLAGAVWSLASTR